MKEFLVQSLVNSKDPSVITSDPEPRRLSDAVPILTPTPSHAPSVSAASSPSGGLSVISDSDLDQTVACCDPDFEHDLDQCIPDLPTTSTPQLEVSDPMFLLHSINKPASTQFIRRFIELEPQARYGFLADVQLCEITPLERAETLVWLYQLTQFHECDSDVFHTSAYMLDTLLCKAKIKSKHMRVAAMACFLITSKFMLEEQDQPIVNDLIANCQEEFSANDLKRMELVILNRLGWQLPTLCPVAYLQDICALIAEDLNLPKSRIQTLMKDSSRKFALCMLSYELQRFKMSTLVSTVIVLEAASLLGRSEEALIGPIAMRARVDGPLVEQAKYLVQRHLRVASSMFGV